jgi:hypothetical protein
MPDPRIHGELSGKQKAFLIALGLILLASVSGYGIWAGASEAAHNRIKEERIWQKCLEQNQPVLSCRAAIKGVG